MIWTVTASAVGADRSLTIDFPGIIPSGAGGKKTTVGIPILNELHVSVKENEVTYISAQKYFDKDISQSSGWSPDNEVLRLPLGRHCIELVHIL